MLKRVRRIRQGYRGTSGVPRVDEMRNRPSDEALRAAAERQIALERRTAAETLLGDPPQGYSALDRRGQG
jgi:hypothetical protein